MLTKDRCLANRSNAAASTGPVTHRGKERSSRNAVRHGLASRSILLPSESRRAFRKFRADLHALFPVRSPVEISLVDRLVETMWRLRRIARIESEMLCRQREERDWVSLLTSRMQSSPLDDEPDISDNWVSQLDAFSKLSRYESRLERSLYRALIMLGRLAGSQEDVPPG